MMPNDPISARQRVREAIARIKESRFSTNVARKAELREYEDSCNRTRQLETTFWQYIQDIEAALTPSPAMTQEEARNWAENIVTIRSFPLPAYTQGEFEEAVADALVNADRNARLSCAAEMEQKDQEVATERARATFEASQRDELDMLLRQVKADSARLRERLERIISANSKRAMCKVHKPLRHPLCAHCQLNAQIEMAKDALSPQPTVDPPAADEHGECPNCANPPHDGPCRRKQAQEPLGGMMQETWERVPCDGGYQNMKDGNGICLGQHCRHCGGSGYVLARQHNGVKTEGHMRGCSCSECTSHRKIAATPREGE